MSHKFFTKTALGALAGLALIPASSLGAVASQQVNAGSLSFINSTPGNVTFPAVTLNGTDQVQTQTQAFDVSDATGSNAGWSITATSTTFTAAGHNMSNTATTIQGTPGTVCDASSSCTLASNSITYPYTMPAAAVAPTATKMFNAAVNTGMGNQTVTPTWSLSIPSTTWAGGASNPYTSTWTFTLVSGP
ncbi:MAG: WxL domain-containing protein [Solirubrobacteraceae bacterium]|nr:WxL domain-containing protein [Solirubrobacteraceae bacterium]